ncbi:hypothetical protein FLP41_08205 [Paracoccus marcusii]|uniref:hypothetical protein n=1 Tax=Paracoccus marcusii TaxID=59779 RepID=UPI002ED2F345|nr:hypothetical protein FLP41_08205 [Paracoccus marcusii]
MAFGQPGQLLERIQQVARVDGLGQEQVDRLSAGLGHDGVDAVRGHHHRGGHPP